MTRFMCREKRDAQVVYIRCRDMPRLRVGGERDMAHWMCRHVDHFGVSSCVDPFDVDHFSVLAR